MTYHRLLHHQSVPASRRERVTPDPALLLRNPVTSGGVEIHLAPDGHIDWLLSGPSTQELSVFATALERAFPGAGVHPELLPCALTSRPADHWTFAWARQRLRHWKPLDIAKEHDYADGLTVALESPLARGHEVVVQFLFRATGGWEENLHLFTSPREKLLFYHQGLDVSMTGSYTKRVPTQWDQEQHRLLSERQAEPPYHVEIRAAAYGPEARTVLSYCLGDSFLRQFLSGKWRSLEFVKEGKKVEFAEVFRSHSFSDFVNGRERRDVARRELADILCPPWSRPHVGLRYYDGGMDSPGLSEAPTYGDRLPPPREYSVAASSVGGAGTIPRSHGRSLGMRSPPSPSSAPSAVPKFLPTRLPEAAKLWIELGTSFQNDPIFLSERPLPWFHAMVLGQPGMGKSTLLVHWVKEILAKKPGSVSVVMDPHGTFVQSVMANLPPELASEVVLLDPARLLYEDEGVKKVALPLNLLAIPNDLDLADFAKAREMIVDNLVYFVRNIWGNDVFGPQIDHNISSLATGMLEIPGTNLVDMYDALTDAKTRDALAEAVKSEGVRKFILNELPRLTNARYSQDRVSSTLNRLGKITNNPLLRVSLCQRMNPVDFRTLLDNHRLILIDLSKSKMGPEASRFLGAMCFARIWLAVLQRGETARQTYLFVDEFQNFVTPSIAHVLSEARKFGLHLIMANQYLEQIPEEIRSAVVNNVDAWCFFRMGVEDKRRACEIARAGRRGWTDETLVSLPPYRALFVYRNQLDMLNTYPPPRPAGDLREIERLVGASTRRYSAPETSLDSPLLVDEPAVVAILEALASKGPLTFEELQMEAAIAPGKLWAAQMKAHQKAYCVLLPSAADRVRKSEITDLGRDYLGAHHTKRSTGKESVTHTDLRARFQSYLRGLGIDLRQVPQGSSSVPLPDAEFEWEGVVYNVEAECTTTETSPDAIVKNLRKALEAGRRCIFLAASQTSATKLLGRVGAAGHFARLDTDYAVMYVESGEWIRWPSERSPPFLPPSRSSPSPSASCPETKSPSDSQTQVQRQNEQSAPSTEASEPEEAAGEPEKGEIDLYELRPLIKAIVTGIVQADQLETFQSRARPGISYDTIMTRLPPAVRERVDGQDIGMALYQLGIPTSQVRVGNGRRRRVCFPLDGFE